MWLCLDGGWSKWSNWTSCTATCGGGVQHRVRTCSSPAPKYKGDFCPGVKRDEKPCNTFDCPCGQTESLKNSATSLQLFVLLDGAYGEWGPWSFCSVSCGNGVRERRRLCVNPEPAHSGRPCPPPNNQTTPCFQPFQCPIGNQFTHGLQETWCNSINCCIQTASGQTGFNGQAVLPAVVLREHDKDGVYVIHRNHNQI
jgi:hypothetical protein